MTMTQLPAAVVLLCILLSSAWVECRPIKPLDFYYFVQQWPGSYCDTKRSCCYPTTGRPSFDFSIHGLWPNYNDGKYPSDCNPRSTFSPNEISDIQTDLNLYWGSLACPSSNSEKFWAHEWKKHGTCSNFTSQHDYFEAGLKLKKSIDLLGALEAASIHPNDSMYSLSSIQDAFARSLGHNTKLECNRDASGKPQLFQVYVCVDADGSTIIDCPVFARSGCPSEVELPAFGSQGDYKLLHNTSEADNLHANQ